MTFPPLPPLNLRALMQKYDLQAHQSLGQNFLQDDNALRKIVQIAEVTPESRVLEIGAGLGSLTRYLAQQGSSVTAVEIDSRMIPALREVLTPFSNVTICQGDILKLDPADLMPESGYQVVANIPYYITSAIIRHLLESQKKPSRMVLTVQKEVAARICAHPDEMSLLALSVQLYGAPHIAASIPAGAFIPTPKVDSAVVCVDLYPNPLLSPQETDLYFKLARAGFSQKRKTLRNSLSAGLAIPHADVEALLTSAKIDPTRRAETLDLEEWFNLLRAYNQR